MRNTMNSDALAAALAEARALEGRLSARLRHYADAQRRLLPDYALAADRLVERIVSAEVGASTPGVGQRLPAFLLPDVQGRLVSLDDVLRKGPAVIALQRGHWCPFCRLAAASLAAIREPLAARGVSLTVITPEAAPSAAAHKASAEAPFPWLTDIDLGYSLELGLAVWVGDEMRAIMSGLGIDLPTYHRNALWCLPVPATFVIGRDGVVAARFIDPDYRQRVDAEDVLAAVDSLDRSIQTTSPTIES